MAAPPSGPASTDVGNPLPDELPQILQTIDWFVAGAGILAAVFFAFRILQPRNAATRLEVVPPRTNRFGEDSVLIAVLAYLLTAAGMAWALDPAAASAAVWRTLAVDTLARVAGIVACTALAVNQFEGGAPAFLLGSSPLRAGRFALLVVGSMLVAFGVCPLIQDWGVWIAQQFWPEFAPKTHPTLERLAKGQPGWVVAWLWVSAAAIAPVAEEIFFRGVLQSALANMLRSRWLAIAVASAAFGAVHFPQPQAVVPLMAMGLVLGYLYERTATLAAPITVHVLFNLKTLVWYQLS